MSKIKSDDKVDLEVAAALDVALNQDMDNETYLLFIQSLALLSAVSVRKFGGQSRFNNLRSKLDEEAVQPIDTIVERYTSGNQHE